MPALTEYQAELGGVTIGAGTDYEFEGPIDGLGVPAPRTSDLDLPTGGTLGGRDLPAARIINLPVAVLGDSPSDTMGLVDTLLAAWAPTSSDTYLDVCLPGTGTIRFTGRPRGVDLDLDALAKGNTARARLTFVALNPVGEPQGS